MIPERTLTQILREAEHVDLWRLNPERIQEEYKEFMDPTITLQRVLRALNVRSSTTRFNSSHPFAIGLGEVVRELAQEEELSVASREGPVRLCSEPPYVGGNPETRHIEVNPGEGEERFNLWRDLREMNTRIEAVYDQQKATEYLLFERLQVRWDEPLHARQIARSFAVPLTMYVYLGMIYV